MIVARSSCNSYQQAAWHVVPVSPSQAIAKTPDAKVLLSRHARVDATRRGAKVTAEKEAPAVSSKGRADTHWTGGLLVGERAPSPRSLLAFFLKIAMLDPLRWRRSLSKRAVGSLDGGGEGERGD